LKAGFDPSQWGGGERSPILVTKTMLIEGSNNLRFIDKKTGAIIHEMPLGAQMTGGTMTYMMNGRQFLIAVVNGTGGQGAELVALALPVAGGQGKADAKGKGAPPPAAGGIN
jgi:quinoprotein glucose dehydrogenase